MNIDGVVFSECDPTGDTYLDTMIHGKEIFDALHKIHHASIHGYEEIECFLANASDHIIDAILTDANVNVDASIECDEQRKHTNHRHAKELIILTLIKRGYSKWVSETYKHWSEDE